MEVDNPLFVEEMVFSAAMPFTVSMRRLKRVDYSQNQMSVCVHETKPGDLPVNEPLGFGSENRLIYPARSGVSHMGQYTPILLADLRRSLHNGFNSCKAMQSSR